MIKEAAANLAVLGGRKSSPCDVPAGVNFIWKGLFRLGFLFAFMFLIDVGQVNIRGRDCLIGSAAKSLPLRWRYPRRASAYSYRARGRKQQKPEAYCVWKKRRQGSGEEAGQRSGQNGESNCRENRT